MILFLRCCFFFFLHTLPITVSLVYWQLIISLLVDDQLSELKLMDYTSAWWTAHDPHLLFYLSLLVCIPKIIEQNIITMFITYTKCIYIHIHSSNYWKVLWLLLNTYFKLISRYTGLFLYICSYLSPKGFINTKFKIANSSHLTKKKVVKEFIYIFLYIYSLGVLDLHGISNSKKGPKNVVVTRQILKPALHA